MDSIPKVEINDIFSKIANFGLIVFAGAGVSADSPSLVPGWFSLNKMIIDVLKRLVTNYLDKDPTWLDDVIQGIIDRRDAGGFPPEYQAQIIEEQCGESYFHALSAVDVTQRNEAHEAIAALARSGIVRAVVTTNFDCLIESSFDAEKIPYDLFVDEEDFRRLLRSVSEYTGKRQAIPIIKIHGTVKSTNSMIDTLQQRECGRKDLLTKLLAHWLNRQVVLYAGFSAADLNHDSEYFGLCRSAKASPGALFVQHPGSKLGNGAKVLLDAYDDKAYRFETTLTKLFSELLEALKIAYPKTPPIVDPDPKGTVACRLKTWADSLDPYQAINVLTALLYAGGEEEAAITILHKTWKSRNSKDTKGAHYARYQYNYGNHCLQSGEMLYEETPQNFARSMHVVNQSSAGYALWNLYRVRRVKTYLQFILETKCNTLGQMDPRLEGDIMFVFAQVSVIYRWKEHLNEIIAAANRQHEIGDIPRAIRLRAAAARLAARSDDPGMAFDLFDFCEWWVRYLNDGHISAELYLAQGIANLELNSYSSAGSCFMRALPGLRQYQLWPLLIEGLIEGLRYYVAENRAEEAIHLVNEASQRIQNGYEIYIPHLGIAVAEYHLGVKKWDRAKRELLKCRPLAKKSNNEWASSKIDTYLELIHQQ